MLKTRFTLIHKRPLTHDVWELIYTCPDLITEPPKPGQYVMFQLAPGLNRSYSLSGCDLEGDIPTFTLIIKRIADGKGSPMICDAEIGTEFSGIIPLGHFTLRETTAAKCFIGTGTGFAPLHYQLSSTDPACRVAFIFGVRHFVDSFYEDELSAIVEHFSDIQRVSYFSQEHEFNTRPTTHESRQGYVTDWITAESIAQYQEFYICGSPAMVKNAREKLEALGVSAAQIYWEQF